MHLLFPDSPLPPASIDPSNTETLRAITATCRDSGLPFRLCYGTPRFRYPLAASFTSRGAGAARL